MLYKTHAVVGAATALALTAPATVPELVVGTAAALVGSLICDIDSGTSTSHKNADIIMLIILALVGAVAAAENLWHLGIYDRIKGDVQLVTVIVAVSVFIAVCLIGKQTPHRSFMHSILCFAILTMSVEYFLPVAVPYFGSAFVSHVLLDFLNKKRLRLLYPFKAGFSLNFCRSDGLINRAFFFAGSVAFTALIIYRFCAIRGFI